MFVGLKMLKDFAKVAPDTLVEDADIMMEEKGLWMILILEDDKLAGYVRKEDIKAALPSKATGLDKHEINYLLSKLTLKSIMRKDITTVPPEMEIESAAVIMSQKNLAGLAVVNADGKLIGYINRSVILDVLAEELGYGQGGSRIVFEVRDRPGILSEVSKIVYDMGYSFISMGVFNFHGRRLIVIRVNADDPAPVTQAIQKAGYDVVGPKDFEQEW